MADKDYGSILSRYLDPSETGFDTVVYQKGKPLLDSEFVLDQEIQNHERNSLVRQTTPSGWLTGDFDRDVNEDFDFRTEENRFYLINKPIVNVNGWVIPLEYTATSVAGENQIDLDTPPTGTGNVAADFVYLEVWRSLVAPDPSTDNKPAADKIYRHGNVESLSGEWLDDDLIDTDPAINTESTKRVQIQYRIKTQRLDDPDDRVGYTDADVYAQGPQTSNTTWQYQPVTGDPGLWRAGNGNTANTLGTVDGYVYSIPIGIVFRRNSDDFDYLGNGNGGAVIADGTSDRPDGLFSDEIVYSDLLDLRRRANLQGFDWDNVMDRNVSMLMDQTLRSWATNTAHTQWYVGGSAQIGNRYLKADDLVPSNATPSDPASGNTFRSVDGIARIYSDRAHVERHVEVYSGSWTTGSNPSVSLDLTATSPIGAPLSDEQPNGTVIVDVVDARLDDSDGSNGYVELEVVNATGLGTQTVNVELETPPVNSSRDIWVTYEIQYPAGSGLNAHVTEEVTNFDIMVHDPTEFDTDIGTTFTNDAAGRQAIRQYLITEFEQGPHREVGLYYTTDSAVTINVYAQDDTTIVLPEHLDETQGTSGVVQVEDPATTTTYTVDSAGTSGRIINLASALPSDDTDVDVTYWPKRPLPVNGATITLYYRTAGIQAVNQEYLTNSDPDDEVVIKPVAVSSHMFVGTASSGSYLTPFPYEAPMNQIAVHVSAQYDGEDELSAPGDISIDDFDANTGFLKLPTFVPLAPVDEFRLQNPISVTTENEEFFDHYQTVDLTEYRPSAIAQGLSTDIEHKVFLPVVAQLGQDTLYGREGEHVLVIFSNYIEADSANRVGFTDSSNTTCAAIYRIKGNPVTY